MQHVSAGNHNFQTTYKHTYTYIHTIHTYTHPYEHVHLIEILNIYTDIEYICVGDSCVHYNNIKLANNAFQSRKDYYIKRTFI